MTARLAEPVGNAMVVLELVAAADGGLTASELLALSDGRLAQGGLYTELSRMVERGWIGRRGGGRYGRYRMLLGGLSALRLARELAAVREAHCG